MSNKKKLGIGTTIALLVAAYLALNANPHEDNLNSEPVQANVNHAYTNVSIEREGQSNQNQQGLKVIRNAYETQLSDVQVQSFGFVKAVLRDDNEGSRHQKFILSLGDGLTVLVAHNIDLSPRIENLEKGDMVEFFGEYEYSPQGGVIHWTHHDPQKRHQDGWLKHNGQIYQ